MESLQELELVLITSTSDRHIASVIVTELSIIIIGPNTVV